MIFFSFSLLIASQWRDLLAVSLNVAIDPLPIDICDVERHNLNSPPQTHTQCIVASHWSLDLIRPIKMQK